MYKQFTHIVNQHPCFAVDGSGTVPVIEKTTKTLNIIEFIFYLLYSMKSFLLLLSAMNT
jgi:hypothetical protein